MATLQQLDDAIFKADAAGDKESIMVLAKARRDLLANTQPANQPAVPEPSENGGLGSAVLNLGMGGLHGIADIGSTLMHPIDAISDATIKDIIPFVANPAYNLLIAPSKSNDERRAAVDAGLQSLGADTESAAFKAGDIGVNVGSWVLPGMAATKVGRAGSGLEKIGKFLGGDNPIRTATAMTSGLASGAAAKESVKDNENLSDNQKLALEISANVLGGMGASGVMGIAQGVGRSGKRVFNAATGNAEGAAGRLINRATGKERDYVQSILESGKVPTISKPIIGYEPRASEIAANAGISGLVRHAENDIMNSTELTGRNFANAKATKDFLQRKTAGTAESRQAYEDSIRADAAAHSEPFKARNAEVDLATVETELNAAIAKHTGNPAITAGLEKLKADIPKPATVKNSVPFYNPITGETEQQIVETIKPVGFREAYNFKQYIDEMLRGNAFDNPVKRSIQQSGVALADTKKALANTLTAVEPEFNPFLKRQAEAIARLERQKLADELIQASSLNTSVVSNQSGVQEVENLLSAPKLSGLLKNKDKLRDLSADQIESFTRAQQHAALQARTGAGLPRNSSTAQNLKTNELIMDDVIRGLVGDKLKTSLFGDAIRTLGKGAGNMPLLRNLSPLSSRQAELSAIFTKAELDPRYMAELMQKYPALDAALDPTLSGALATALRGSFSQQMQR